MIYIIISKVFENITPEVLEKYKESNKNEEQSNEQVDLKSKKSKWSCFCFLMLYGIFGAHRFYVGKVKSGLIWLLTLGCFGIGLIIDSISILSDNFTDVEGKYLCEKID